MDDHELRNRFRRDFTAEPIRASLATKPAVPATQSAFVKMPEGAEMAPPSSTQFEANAHQHSSRKRRKFKKTAIFLSIFGLLVGLSAGGYFFIKPKLHHDKTAVLASSTSYKSTVYYPAHLPPGYIVNKNFQAGEQPDTLIYSVKDSQGDKFTVSLQTLKDSGGFMLLKQKFDKNESDEFSIPIGSAIVGKIGGSLLGTILTNDSVLIIISASNPNTQPQLETITRAFQAAK